MQENKMLRIFHIDCGRKYFTLSELKEMADYLSRNKYTHFELAIGNDGLRFLLDDMTVETSGFTYESEAVKRAINAGNKAYCDSRENELTESEMEELVDHCKRLNIGIIPLLNSPGHMDAIAYAMEQLGLKNVRYHNSATTIDFDNAEAVSFTQTLVHKYIKWFASHKSEYFNMGCDEYANDVLTSGFGSLCNPKTYRYDRFITYANHMAKLIKDEGMKPVMFNDGAYYNKTEPIEKLDTDIIISYWNIGWPGYSLAPASYVAGHGHKIINTYQNWYYVMGRRPDSKNTMFNCEDTFRELVNTKKNELPGGETVDGTPVAHIPGISDSLNSSGKIENIGHMLAIWCDEPEVDYNDEENAIIKTIIERW